MNNVVIKRKSLKKKSESCFLILYGRTCLIYSMSIYLDYFYVWYCYVMSDSNLLVSLNKTGPHVTDSAAAAE